MRVVSLDHLVLTVRSVEATCAFPGAARLDSTPLEMSNPMTKKEWLACKEPDDLLEFLRDRASDRQFRLFMCACCRRFLALMPRKPKHDLRLCEKYVAYGEQFAEGLITWEEMAAALDETEYANVSHEGYLAALAARQATYKEVAGCTRPMLRGRNLIAHPASSASEYSRTVIGRLQANNMTAKGSTAIAKKRTATIAEKRYQIALLHDIFDNRFHPVTLDKSRLSSTVIDLARTIYGENAFDRMPILANALQDAGCASKEIINHCRSEGPHVRGCWAVDLILGKE
jgi:hypothetical protein